MAKSVTQETKAKFDSLLKVALNKKRSKSTLSLIGNEKTVHDIGITNEVVDTGSDAPNKNFILDKFLNDDEVKENDSGEFIKPPVPKPRKKFQQSSSNSNETYSVKSAKVLNVVNKNNCSSDSNDTCDLPRAIRKEDSDTSDSSNRTYNVSNTPMGDILYNDKVNKALIVDLNRTSSVARTSKSQKLSEHEIEMANFHEEPEKIQSISDILQETEISSDSAVSTKITFENELKKKKKKKKKENLIQTMEESPYKYEEILNVIVHNTDKLELNSFVIHPVVKVYLVNYETGQYIRKTDSSRGVVFHIENKNLTYIMPVITQNFNLQEKRQFKPEWEESIIINEDFKYITNPETRVILFFELLDFVGFSEAALQSSVYSRGWHRIAWAFLKINAADGTTNTGKKLRLQLYKPGKDVKSSCPVFDWWCGKRIKYSSTLYITVKGIISPNTVVETFRSKTPLEREKSTSILDEHATNPESTGDMIKNDKEKVKAVLSILENDTCKLPNSFLTNIDSGDEGCYVLKFSNTGTFLACAVNIKENYTLILYTVPEFETYYKLPSHQELIYNISFSKDDLLVATSSSDGTVSIWNLEKWRFSQILPHPSFVYWCEIAKDTTIATGCYDKIVRIWTSSTNEAKNEYFLIDELVGHAGYITSICFNSTTTILFSSDSIGEIFLWKRADKVWKHLKTIKLPELRNTLINQILLHRKERKLIVHARDNVIRIVDAKNECVLNWLEGALNIKVRTLCCISSCGSYVVSGSENGIIHIWNVDTGKSVETYHPYKNTHTTTYIPIHTIDMSPKGSLMAFGHFGSSVPIQIYSYDPKKTSNKPCIPSDEKPLKITIQKTKTRKNRVSDSEEDNEKDVDLKNILEKIDRIIK